MRPPESREDLRQGSSGTVDFLRGVLDSSPDAVLVADPHGCVTYANPAVEDFLGWVPEQLVGCCVSEICASVRDVERVARMLGARERVFREEVELRHRDGTTRWASVSADVLRLEGCVSGVVAFLRDETESRRYRLEAARKTAELEQAVRAVAHDLRSPLVSVLGFSRLLREDCGDRLDSKGHRFLQRIEEAGRTMEELLRDLLEFSRIGHDREPAPLVDPRPVLSRLLAELKPRLDAKAIQLLLPEQPPLVRCSRSRLYQIFSNLIGNAIDHMGPRPDPCIQVRLEEHAEGGLLIVEDNGRGIDPSHHEEIFEIFRSFPRPDGSKGTGLGLAIVKRIAEVHGGRLWVTSRPDEGAAFRVLLPWN